MIINNIKTDSNNIKFINTGLLSGIANSIRKKGFMSPDEKIKVQDYASIITSIGNELSGDFVNGGVYIPAPRLTNMNYAFYYNASILYPVCGRNVVDMTYAYIGCYNLTGSPVCGPNVISMNSTYSGGHRLTGSPVCGPNVVNMYATYSSCHNLTGSPVCGPNVVNMNYTYVYCNNLTGSPVCGPNVVDMAYAYSNCHKLTGSPVCGSNVVDMAYAYEYCNNLTGPAVIGPNVVNMYSTYGSCNNLTGSPVCGPNVVDMAYAYSNCHKLTGSPVCGSNVVDMAYAYEYCNNLTGPAVCGSNVVNMTRTYSFGCFNLTGPAVIGPNVVYAHFTYYNTFIFNDVLIFSNVLNGGRGQCDIFGGAIYDPNGQIIEWPPNIQLNNKHIIFSTNNLNYINSVITDMVAYNGRFNIISGTEYKTYTMPYKGYGEIKNVTYKCEHLLIYKEFNVIVSYGVEVEEPEEWR